jgi:hypothetical protein
MVAWNTDKSRPVPIKKLFVPQVNWSVSRRNLAALIWLKPVSNMMRITTVSELKEIADTSLRPVSSGDTDVLETLMTLAK